MRFDYFQKNLNSFEKNVINHKSINIFEKKTFGITLVPYFTMIVFFA